MGLQTCEESVARAPVVGGVVRVRRLLRARKGDVVPPKRVADDVDAELIEHRQALVERPHHRRPDLEPRVILDAVLGLRRCGRRRRRRGERNGNESKDESAASLHRYCFGVKHQFLKRK
jgi:hypothetical protein